MVAGGVGGVAEEIVSVAWLRVGRRSLHWVDGTGKNGSSVLVGVGGGL